MAHKAKTVRLCGLVMAVVLLMSTITAAGAVRIPSDVIDAKDELATVDITQTYNFKEEDYAIHNYATDGSEVSITYAATLQMTDEMAYFLQPRQERLLRAKFNVHVEMDMDWLEFVGSGDTVTATFTSTFLKPWDLNDGYRVDYPDAFADRAEYLASGYESKLVDYSNGVFTYEISVSKEWAEQQDTFEVPMELIAYYDGTAAYGYDQIKNNEAFKDKPLYYGDFTVEDWTAPITLSLADLRVRDEKAATVTSASATWYKIDARGTVDGEFAYITDPVSTIGLLAGYDAYNYVTTLEFGNQMPIEEWTSNVVYVLLKNEAVSPYLNMTDHFAYIIGMPDGLVHPEGNITRAEVATIFFRMLKDEVRSQYWSTANNYNDVQSSDWYNNAISTLTNLGVVEGMPDGGFHPTDSITRAEFATMAVRFFEIEAGDYSWSKDAFNDIAGHWANTYINQAYLLGVVKGDGVTGAFRPNDVITRAEAMTIVNNTLRRSPVKEGLLPVEQMITWPDNMDTAAWFYEAVQEATNSHEFSYATSLTGEQWTAPLPVRDWAAFETEWSNANSAVNPGEVTGR